MRCPLPFHQFPITLFHVFNAIFPSETHVFKGNAKFWAFFPIFLRNGARMVDISGGDGG